MLILVSARQDSGGACEGKPLVRLINSRLTGGFRNPNIKWLV